MSEKGHTWKTLDHPGEILRVLLSRRQIVDDCWLYTGTRTLNGYGRMRVAGRYLSTHHLAAFLFKQIPLGVYSRTLVLRHSCDHAWCFNPAHLQLGTQKENVADAFTRGRRAFKTHCPAGHEYTSGSYYLVKGRYKSCKVCSRARQHKTGNDGLMKIAREEGLL